MTSAHCKSGYYILRFDIDCHLGAGGTMEGETDDNDNDQDNDNDDNDDGGGDCCAPLRCPGTI